MKPSLHVAFNLNRRDVRAFATDELVAEIPAGWSLARSCWTEQEASVVADLLHAALFGDVDGRQ